MNIEERALDRTVQKLILPLKENGSLTQKYSHSRIIIESQSIIYCNTDEVNTFNHYAAH